MIKIVNTKNYIKVSDVQARINNEKQFNELITAKIKELQAKIAEDNLGDLEYDMISLQHWLREYEKEQKLINELCWVLLS